MIDESNPEAEAVSVAGMELPPLKNTTSNTQDYTAQNNHGFALEMHLLSSKDSLCFSSPVLWKHYNLFTWARKLHS